MVKMVQAVLIGRLTGTGFDFAWFSSLSSMRLCIYSKIFLHTSFSLPNSELSIVGLVLDLVD